MEYGMDRTKLCREADDEGGVSDAVDDFVRAEELVGEFARGLSGAEMGGKNKYLISDGKVWCGCPAFVRRSLIALLSYGDMDFELGVELVEVHSHVTVGMLNERTSVSSNKQRLI